MRRNGLGLTVALAALLTLTACQSPEPIEEPATATRAEVTNALRRQLEMVRHRHESLATDDSSEARAEQAELLRLAAEIAVRIVRVDPEADLDGLLVMMHGNR